MGQTGEHSDLKFTLYFIFYQMQTGTWHVDGHVTFSGEFILLSLSVPGSRR